MARIQASGKRLAIDKANAQMVATVAVASFVTIFCLVAAHAVWGQISYQARVTTAENKTNQRLKQNITAFDKLSSSFKTFDSASTNIIGGGSTGNGGNDGDNAKIIVDALPDKYDFPALTSSIEKILTGGGFNIGSISGTDDQINQQNNTSSPSPQPVPIPVSFTVNNASYNSVQQLITTLQQSIRPIQIDTFDLTGGANNMTLTVNAHTYYQPGKNLTITQQVVK